MPPFKKKDTEEKPPVEAAPEAASDTELEPDAQAEPDRGGFKTQLGAGAKAALTARAREEVQREIVAQEKEAFLKAEKDRLRKEAGMGQPNALPAYLNEMVEITIDTGYEGAAFIQLNQPNGVCYHHGQKYVVPRHVANTLNEIMFAGHKLSRHIKGEKVWGRNRPYGSTLSAVSGRTDTGKDLVH